MLDDAVSARGDGADALPKSEKKRKSLREKREQVQQKRDKSVMRALRVEIAKPIDNPASWEELGPTLRMQRAICGRLLRAATLAYIHAVKYPEQHKDEAGKTIPASTVAYQEVQIEIDSKRAWARKELSKKVSKAELKLIDALPANEDDLLKPDGAAQLKEVLTKLESDDARRLLNWSLFRLPGGTKSAISNTAVLKASEWLKKGCDSAIPSFKNASPIPIRKQEFDIIEEPEERVVVKGKLAGKVIKGTRICLVVQIYAGRGSGRVKLIVRPTKGSHWQSLRKIIKDKEEPGCAPGALKILFDESARRIDGKKGKWFAIISYSSPLPDVPDECDPEKVLVVHRGMFNLLTCASSAATNWKVIDSGRRYVAFKKRILSRQRDMRAIPKAERGEGAKGHGRKRRYRTYDALDTKISDFRKTMLQQAWARVIELARKWGCGTIVLEDYSSIQVEEPRFQTQFPWAESKTWGEYVCKREGFRFMETSSAYISQCCPRCGHTEDSGRQVVRRRGMFHCQRCNFERPLDMVSTIHMLRRAAPKVNAWDIALEKELKNALQLTILKGTIDQNLVRDKKGKKGK